ncbi:MAG: uracil-DNA glycosylase family protein [Flavobacteriales bacterium]|nr:uracil-DNA glycosylase family protein [Flavobacteriales bacterium]MCB9192329.1 uracil-DNA glycosylase family protein [Flavobacteriales bacterium]MCB9203729.1 uracil-DNA glycosylase family protein [Flavobacteriales bacterium]
MESLLSEIRNCTICSSHLSHGANPILAASANSRIVIVGQAPGSIVHRTGIPWDDKSGERLRSWLGVSEKEFYNKELFALIPMGFCYPGKGKSGDLPPRPECAPTWHHLVLDMMPNKELVLLIGNYAQQYYLKDAAQNTLTDTVRNYAQYLPTYLPLPHPSPRNNIWLKKNAWFEESVIPELRRRTNSICNTR